MWKVGGTKIERTRACYIFLVYFSIFGPIAFKRIEHEVLVSEPMFDSFQSDQTKNKKVLVFLTPHMCREKSVTWP